MGVVWAARNEALGSFAAIKVLRRLPNALALERFLREARGLAKLDHPHVVRVFDAGTSKDGEPYLVMELLRGHDLGAELEGQKVVALARVVEIATQVCKALTHAAAADVVHRDIKPANLFLLEGDDVFVKVLDFGVARFGSEGTDLTRDGVILGTPSYMSPEQFAASKTVDVRADLWSLAVVIYRALTGALPFEADNAIVLSFVITRGEFLAPCSVNPALPAGIDAFMRRALAPDPAQRFATPRDFAEALADAARGAAVSQPIGAPPLITLHQPQTPATVVAPRAKKGGVVAVVLLLLLGLGGVGAGAWTFFTRSPVKTKPSSKKSAAVSVDTAAKKVEPAPAPQPSAAPPVQTAVPQGDGKGYFGALSRTIVQQLQKQPGGELQVLSIALFAEHAVVDLRSGQSTRVDRYVFRPEGNDPIENASEDYERDEVTRLAFTASSIDWAVFEKIADDAPKRAKGGVVQSIVADRQLEQLGLGIRAMLEDADGRTVMVNYDFKGAFRAVIQD